MKEYYMEVCNDLGDYDLSEEEVLEYMNADEFISFCTENSSQGFSSSQTAKEIAAQITEIQQGSK